MMTTTTPLTSGQAELLNDLARNNEALRRALLDLTKRVDEHLTNLDARQHLAGFGSDVLGQPGREVQHGATVRATLITAAFRAGVAEPVILEALGYDVEGTTTRHRRARYFQPGYTLEIPDDEPAEVDA